MQTEQPSPVSRRTLGVFGAMAGAAAILVVLTGIRAREEASARLRDWADDQAIPTVAVALPDARVLSATIDLPGRLEAYYRAPIFARVNGYLKGWSADIGAKVRAGQVIAEIKAPDLDQQLLQARRSRKPTGQREAVGSNAHPPQIAAGLEFRFDAGD